MKRLMIALFVGLLILSRMPVQAQGELTETYSDDRFAFSYPAGWIVGIDDSGSLLISSAPIQETSLLTAEPGIIKINIMGRTEEANEIADQLNPEQAMIFMSGYLNGALVASYQFIISLAGAFSGEEAEIKTEVLRAEMSAIADRDGFIVETTLTGTVTYHLLSVALDGPILILAGADEDTFTAQRDTIMALAGTVRLVK